MSTPRPIAAVVLLVAVSLWLVWITLLPVLLQAYPVPRPVAIAAAFTYRVGGVVCHRDPVRSFTLGGIPMPVCARCTGLYTGAAFGAFVAFHWVARRWRPAMSLATVRLVLVVCAVPTALLWLAEWLAGVRVDNVSRWAGGLPLGAAVAWAIGVALGGTLPPDTPGPSGVH